MTLSFAQLDTPVTEAEAEAAIIQRLSELGFASKGWQSGSMQLTIGVKLPAWLYSKFTYLVQAVLRGGFNDTAEGEFLTRFSASQYDNTRKPAVPYRYNVRHTTAAGEGPHTVNAGDLIGTNGTYLYRNVDDGSVAYPVNLTSAATVDLTYEAEIPGSKPVAADGTITTLVTSLAGVTITNPEPSLVQAGADEETDAALRERNPAKWGLLSIEVPEDGYKNLVLAVTGVGRAVVDAQNPRGPGTVDVYVAGPSSAAGATEETAAQAAIDARKSVTADVDVVIAPSSNVTVSGVVYYSAAYTSAPTQITEAITNYVNTLPIGGATLTSSLKGVPVDGIIAAIRAVPGVLNVDLTNPTADHILSAFNIAAAVTTGLSTQKL